jgi:hypothetical protein
MKKATIEAPLRTPDDSAEMSEAIDFAETLDAEIFRCSHYQLKIGPINFYPSTGVMFHDQKGSLKARTLDGLKSIIHDYI